MGVHIFLAVLYMPNIAIHFSSSIFVYNMPIQIISIYILVLCNILDAQKCIDHFRLIQAHFNCFVSVLHITDVSTPNDVRGVLQDFCPEIAVSLLPVYKREKKKECNVYPQERRLFQVNDCLLIFTCCALLTAVPANILLPLNASWICSEAAERRCLLIQKSKTQMWGSARCFLDYFFIVCRP